MHSHRDGGNDKNSALIRYAYDTADRIIQVTYPSGRTLDYARNSAGQITTVSSTFNGVSQTLAEHIGYLPFGPVKSLTYGNSLLETATFDLDYQLSDKTLSTLASQSFAWDPVGNLSSLTDHSNNTLSQGFGYDDLDRLIAETGFYGSRDFEYDPVGNRSRQIKHWVTSAGVSKTSRPVYRYTDDANQLLQINNQVAYSYDAMGNTLVARNGKYVYRYTDSARLASVTVRGTLKGEYSYNAQGQRVKKIRYNNAGDALIWRYQYDQHGQLLSEAYFKDETRLIYRIDYVWLGSQPIAQLKTTYRNNGSVLRNETLYLHTDHLNTPRSASDDSQRIVWRWDSDAFGETKADRDPDGDGKRVDVNLRFPGQYYDGESGLNYNYYRYYDPGTGRYVTSDPIGLNGGINTYGYVTANPLRFIDPKGLHYYQSLGNYVPHTHNYPAPCPSCSVDQQPSPDGMLDPYSLDHYRLPSCRYCTEQFSICISGTATDVASCARCAKSRGADLAACVSCTTGSVEAARCFIQHCEEGRKGQNGECKPNGCYQ